MRGIDCKRELLDALRVELRGALSRAPKGKLHVSQSHGYPQFYRRLGHDGKGKYLSIKKDARTIKRLAQKSYDEQLLELVEQERDCLRQIAELMSDCGYSDESMGVNLAYQEACVLTGEGSRPIQRDSLRLSPKTVGLQRAIPESIQGLIAPRVLYDEAYADQWANDLAQAGDPMPLSQGGCVYKANDGSMMRSKSEVLIANKLHDAGLPYVYEQPLTLDGHVVHPDFIVLNPITRQEFVWEHLGMMDDPDYASNAISKLGRYASCGLVPGKGLVITQETSSCPLDLATVDLQIALLSASA